MKEHWCKNSNQLMFDDEWPDKASYLRECAAQKRGSYVRCLFWWLCRLYMLTRNKTLFISFRNYAPFIWTKKFLSLAQHKELGTGKCVPSLPPYTLSLLLLISHAVSSWGNQVWWCSTQPHCTILETSALHKTRRPTYLFHTEFSRPAVWVTVRLKL